MSADPIAEPASAESCYGIAWKGVVCPSAKMREIGRVIGKMAMSSCRVMIFGESGVGKEIVARTIHQNSLRRDQPFVEVNCAAIPDELVEDEFFGHERGAYTGAHDRQPGKFQRANQGTIFLDEIGDLSLRAQSKVLRAVQAGEFEPLGSRKTAKVDVRVISATRKNLRRMIEQGTFREDLFYRLVGMDIEVPPLRERLEDVAPLANSFLAALPIGRVREISPAAIKALLRYRWPGNVRELRNVVEAASIHADPPHIELKHLPSEVGGAKSRSAGMRGPLEGGFQEAAGFPTFQEIETRYFRALIEYCGGNMSLAARTAGIARRTLYCVKQRAEKE